MFANKTNIYANRSLEMPSETEESVQKSNQIKECKWGDFKKKGTSVKPQRQFVER